MFGFRKPKPVTGPAQRAGEGQAEVDAIYFGRDFVEKFIEATADFEDWYLYGYRQGL